MIAEGDGFLSDEERGIDPTWLACNDCGRIQNAPKRRKIPEWWIDALIEEKGDIETA